MGMHGTDGNQVGVEIKDVTRMLAREKHAVVDMQTRKKQLCMLQAGGSSLNCLSTATATL